MKKHSIFLLLPAVLFALAFLSDGPCDSPIVGGHTGAPGETGCDGCHAGTPNTGPGALALAWEDTAGHYVPGKVYDAVVTLEQAELDKFGFVALALKDNGNLSTGQFSIDDAERTRTFSHGGRKYASHTPCGADAAPTGSLSWTFHWKAPATDVGPITIYLAGLAANHNHSTSGDDTYTMALHLLPADTIASASGERFGGGVLALRANTPLPGEPLKVRLSLPRAGSVQFRLLDTGGKTCRKWQNLPPLAPGENTVDLPLGDDLPAGVYFLQASVEGLQQAAAAVAIW